MTQLPALDALARPASGSLAKAGANGPPATKGETTTSEEKPSAMAGEFARLVEADSETASAEIPLAKVDKQSDRQASAKDGEAAASPPAEGKDQEILAAPMAAQPDEELSARAPRTATSPVTDSIKDNTPAQVVNSDTRILAANRGIEPGHDPVAVQRAVAAQPISQGSDSTLGPRVLPNGAPAPQSKGPSGPASGPQSAGNVTEPTGQIRLQTIKNAAASTEPNQVAQAATRGSETSPQALTVASAPVGARTIPPVSPLAARLQMPDMGTGENAAEGKAPRAAASDVVSTLEHTPSPRDGTPRTAAPQVQTSQAVVHSYTPPTFEEARKPATDAEGLLNGVEAPRSERSESAPTQLPRSQSVPTPQAQGIAQQMAAAARQVAPGSIELRLYPEELGRVRLQFDISEQALVVSITAERSETADLMRRHLDQLAREMQALGYRDVSFRFGGNGGSAGFGSEMAQDDKNASENASASGTRGPDELAAATPPPSAPRISAEGLDLRI